MLNVLDFGAVADGVTDCAAAMQRAINQAQYEHRALQVPAGIYRVDSGLVVNTTQHSTGKYSPSTQHWQVAPLRLLGEGSNNGGGESVIFAGQPMAAVLTFASRQPGTLSEMDEGNATTGHAVEQLTLDANELANFSAFAPAIWGAQWKSVSFRHGLIAGLYIGYGWIHTIEDCAFKNNAVANLYLDRAINAVNVLNNNFAASAGVGIIANGGEALRIVGNCFQSLGGPAIYANQMGALTISGSYYEGNNQRAANYTWPGLPAGAANGGLCAEVVLNGAGNQTAPGRWSELVWSTNPARLGLLVEQGPAGGPRYVMAPQPLVDGNRFGSAIIEGSYHNPDQSQRPGAQYYGVFVAGGEGISVRNNDCRACAKRHASRQCAVIGGGNVSGVDQARNTGEWS